MTAIFEYVSLSSGVNFKKLLIIFLHAVLCDDYYVHTFFISNKFISNQYLANSIFKKTFSTENFKTISNFEYWRLPLVAYKTVYTNWVGRGRG